jgi:hypothetical protein
VQINAYINHLVLKGRDELAIKSLSNLRSLGTIDEHGILHMLNRQVRIECYKLTVCSYIKPRQLIFILV